MIDRGMARKACPDLGINRALIGAEMRILGNSLNQDRLQRLGGPVRNMAQSYFTAALNERDDSFVALPSLRIGAILRLAAEIGPVCFHEFAFAHRLRNMCIAHTFPDTVRHEPCSPIGIKAELPPKLMGAHALLTEAKQPSRQQPFVHRNM